MKLFRLPYLVLIEVIKQLHPTEYLVLSLCSQRTIRALKTVKYRKSRLVVESRKQKYTIWNTTNWYFSIMTPKGALCVMYLDTNSGYVPSWTSHRSDWQLGDESLGITIYDNEVSGFSPTQKADLTRDIQKYICDLFSLPTEIVYRGRSRTRLFKHLIPNSIHTSVLYEDPADGIIKDFYKFHQNQVLSIHNFLKNDDLVQRVHATQRIRQVENLVASNTHAGIKWYMLHFQGSNALFHKAHLQMTDINEFLEQWKGKESDNLETLIVRQDPAHNIDDVEGITDGLEPWDTNKLQKFYPYDSIISEHYTFQESTFDCEGGFYIRRETDGRVATLKLTPNYFVFFVWDN